ncbi:hypothetical protein BMS3Abin04_01495 [bacterium BMS3Abin04]|nr:hypothetical protein BMS3Abin04_01495 [bacterium BMS3Abin04]
MFDHWSDGSTVAYNHKFYPTQHNTYTAYLKGRPNNSYRNLHFNDSDPVGTPVKIMWNQHPDTNVTKYEIWRHEKNESAHKIATVNRNSKRL